MTFTIVQHPIQWDKIYRPKCEVVLGIKGTLDVN